MSRLLSVVLALCVLEAVAAAQYGPPPPPPGYGPPPPPPGYGPVAYGSAGPGYHEHDGFYLRLDIGFGGTSMKSDDADVTISGPGGSFGVAVGGVVAPNLIIFGEVFDDIAINPDIQFGSITASTQDTSAGVVGLGAGLAYYIMPINIYLSGTVAASRLTASQHGDEVAHSAWGGGLSLMVGKEWWVSDNWGIGGALQLYGGRIKDNSDSSSATWNVGAIALVFSATYN
jgi:hypothetical protein